MKPMVVKIKAKKVYSDWGVKMAIGNQSFYYNAFCETKDDATWHLQMMKIALENAGCKVKVLK